ncbi:related to molybdenum cofactor sulfurase [Sporisorium reilianum f. sp. reilianum]|uniref:Related to molybdenum cofactor sulfurase n=1 Tax=Sporisorium reilianum f. sp. reilianum TaxID=72559 RepID=A0A2N8UEI9_9BASI|nr:related to molybdenum cofactor sulfurase [Sporisorium reilianum f. sp. reilianum]
MVLTHLKAARTALTSPLAFPESLTYQRDKAAFLVTHPTYHDPSLSSLRKREFGRLGASVYLDYTGAALYPSSLVRMHARWLYTSVAGNPHSDSPASLLSSAAMHEARRAVLDFFDADEAEYDVVWTSNASGGFRIVGETYDWAGRRVLVPRDAHNSLNGLARLAQAGGGRFEFIEFDAGEQDAISRRAYVERLTQPAAQKGLVFFTGQSNITGTKLDLSLLPLAKQHGWHVGLDAAALAPSTRISLRGLDNSVDFMVVSLYKICGYPTGLGALLMRKERYADLTRKKTFYGGNIIGITMDRVDFTLVQGPERFEDGTPNFAAMASVKDGLEFAARWMDRVRSRNDVLMRWLVRELDGIYYPAQPAVESESAEKAKRSSSFSSTSSACSAPGPIKLVRIGGPTTSTQRGTTLPLVLTSPSGHALNYRFVIFAAARLGISLRGGPCMCNPGASSSVMQRGLITDLAASTLLAEADVGLVRVSLGTATNFRDVWRLVDFVKKLTVHEWRMDMWRQFESVYPGREMCCDIEELQKRATAKR